MMHIASAEGHTEFRQKRIAEKSGHRHTREVEHGGESGVVHHLVMDEADVEDNEENGNTWNATSALGSRAQIERTRSVPQLVCSLCCYLCRLHGPCASARRSWRRMPEAGRPDNAITRDQGPTHNAGVEGERRHDQSSSFFM